MRAARTASIVSLTTIALRSMIAWQRGTVTRPITGAVRMGFKLSSEFQQELSSRKVDVAFKYIISSAKSQILVHIHFILLSDV